MDRAIIVETKDGNNHAFLSGKLVISGDSMLIVNEEGEVQALFTVSKVKAAYPKYINL